MKIFHWEYDASVEHYDLPGRAMFYAGVKRDLDTRECTAIYFRWTYRLMNGEAVYLNCICEDDYPLEMLLNKTIESLNVLKDISEMSFRAVFAYKLREIGITVPNPEFDDDPLLLNPLLVELYR
jgi:hypothetical protein